MSRVILVHVGMVNGVRAYAACDAEDEKAIGDKETIVCDIKSNKTARTELQNRSIHKYFEILCNALNDAGWDMVATMKKLSKNVKIPWSPHAIKERLWRVVQIDTYGKESSTKLNTDEISVVYEALNQVTSSKLGVSVPFPDKYSLMDKQLGRE